MNGLAEADTDPSGETGARRLAKQIEMHWQARGYRKIESWVEPVALKWGQRRGTGDEMHPKICYCVRSNMTGGLPPV